MTFKDILSLAWSSLETMRDLVRKIIAGMAVIVMLIVSVGGIVIMYVQFKSDFDKRHLMECYIFRRETGYDGSKPYTDSGLEEIMDSLKGYRMYDVLPDGSGMPAVKDVELVIDGVKYQAVNYPVSPGESSETLTAPNSLLEIGLADSESGFFPETLFPEAGSILIQGAMPAEPGEIAVDDYLIRVFGISDNDLVGRRISVLTAGSEIFSEYAVTGIVDSNVLDEREPKYSPDNHFEHIYVYPKAADRYASAGSTRYYFKDFGEAVAHMDNIPLNTILDSLDYDIGFTGGLEKYCTMYKLMNTAGIILLAIAAGIVIAAVVTECYLMYFYRDRNRRQDDMLSCLGMNSRDLGKLAAVKLVYICGIAAAIGIICGFIITSIMSAVLSNVIGFSG